MKFIVYFVIVFLIVQCDRTSIKPVPLKDDIFLFDTLINEIKYYSPEYKTIRDASYEFRWLSVDSTGKLLTDSSWINFSSDVFFRHNYLYRLKRVNYPYEIDSYVHTIDSRYIYHLDFFFKNNKIDNVSIYRVIPEFRYLDGAYVLRQYFPITKSAAIDTLKKWGFIDEKLEYIIPNLKKR